MRRRLLALGVLTVGSLACWTGCQPAPQKDASSDKPVAPARAQSVDTPEIQTALLRFQKLGGKIDRDADNYVVSIDLIGCGSTNADAELIARVFPEMQRLKLYGPKITDDAVPHIIKLKKLVDLTLENTEVRDEAIQDLPRLQGLKSLSLRRDLRLTGKALAQMRLFPKLQNLSLLYNPFDNNALAELKGLENLRVLDIRGCDRVGDAGMKSVGTLFGLRVLKLRNPALTDRGIDRLRDLTGLKDLAIQDAPISDESLKLIGKFAELETLDLMRCTSITDDGLENLKGLTKLHTVMFRGTSLSGAGLMHLAGAHKLRRLDLNESGLDDTGSANLKQFAALERLALWNTSITSAGLENLQELTNLVELNLKGTAVNDDGMDSLRSLNQLQDLNLDETKVTDAGLEKLQSLTHLKKLTVRGTPVTAEGIQKFRKALAQCVVNEEQKEDAPSE